MESIDQGAESYTQSCYNIPGLTERELKLVNEARRIRWTRRQDGFESDDTDGFIPHRLGFMSLLPAELDEAE